MGAHLECVDERVLALASAGLVVDVPPISQNPRRGGRLLRRLARVQLHRSGILVLVAQPKRVCGQKAVAVFSTIRHIRAEGLDTPGRGPPPATRTTG
jgi:hypothetical protein